MKYEKIYKKLRKEYSDEEIVDSMLIPQDLTEKGCYEIKIPNRKLPKKRKLLI